MSVSVIIPFYNTYKYLAKAIESCLIQNEVGEIILVDDGSSNYSAQITENYVKNHSHITVLRHEENKGRSAARNTGIIVIKSEYLAFLDADDYYGPDRFLESLRLLKSDKSLDGIYEYVETIFEYPDLDNGFYPKVTGIKEAIPPSHLFEYLVLGKGDHFSLIGCTFRTKTIKNKYEFDLELKTGEDTDFIWKIARDKILAPGGKVANTFRNVHGANTSFNEKEVLKNKVLLYKKWLDRLEHPRMNAKIRKKIINSYAHYSSLALSENRFVQQITKLQKICYQNLILKS